MAFVSGATGTTGSHTGTFTVTVTKSVTAGNSLIVLVNTYDNQSIVPASTWVSSISDNASGGSNTYSPAAGTTNYFATTGAGGTHYAGWLAYCQSLKSTASLTVTASMNSGATLAAFTSIVIVEYSGLGTFDVVGAMNGQYQPASTANAVTSGTVSVAGGDTVIGITIDWSGNGTITAGTGFTTDYNVALTYMSESLTQGSTATRGATFTASVTTDVFITGMLAFRPSAAGPLDNSAISAMVMP